MAADFSDPAKTDWTIAIGRGGGFSQVLPHRTQEVIGYADSFKFLMSLLIVVVIFLVVT